MICRTCQNAYIPTSDNKREKEGNAIMVKYGYRQCKAAVSAEEKGRWVTGGCKCVYQNRYIKREVI